MRRRDSAVYLSLALAVLAGACSGSASGTIQLVTGVETDTFSLAPAPVKLEIQSVGSSGKATVLATAPLPTSNVDIGQQSESTLASFQAIGLDAHGKRVVFGASLPVFWGALDGATLPVFVQRVGAFARLPGPLGDARQAPLLADVQGQYLFIAGGSTSASASSTQIYDFLVLSPLTGTPTLPLAPSSVAFVGTVGWVFASDGTAKYLDLSSNTSTAIPSLSGASFADIAGGTTVVGDSGIQYVVGATRGGGSPTSAILVIDPSDTSDTNYQVAGRPRWVNLTYPRLGASATWVEGRGLVVAGGSATAPGVEILAAGAFMTAPLAYPPDDTVFAGATALSNESVLLAGGVSVQSGAQGSRTLDLTCAASCTPATWQPAPPDALIEAQAFPLSATEVLVVGNALSGATHVYRMTSSHTTEVPTKVPHVNARAIVTPVGSIAIVGGSDLIETFVL